MVINNNNNVVPLQSGGTILPSSIPVIEQVEYIATDDGFKMVHTKKSGVTEKMISNFTAEIITMRHFLDGDKEEIKLGICYENEFHKSVPFFIDDVSYKEFQNGKFPLDMIEVKYEIGIGSERHFIKAVSQNSTRIKHTYHFKNLGWQKHEYKTFFVHAGGIISRDKLDNVKSDIDSPFNKYDLSLPNEIPDLKDAFKYINGFLSVAPSTVTYPLLAAVGLAPINTIVTNRTSLFLVGPRQSMKTTLASLAQSFFGSGFDGKSQMVDFTSTDNSIEVIMHNAKNCLLVVDDYNRNNKSCAKVASVLERAIRSVGNACAKQRMTTNGKLQKSNQPKCVPIITGEELPEGESTIARTLVTNIVASDVDVKMLNTLQHHAKKGVPVLIMHQYIKWIAENFDTLPLKLERIHNLFRNRCNIQENQRRLADNVADFMTGIYCFMLFARELKVVNDSEFQQQMKQAFIALRNSARRTEIAIDRDNIGKLFLYALNDGIKEKTVALAKIGMQQDSSLPVIGWYDDDSVYLFPQKAHGMVKNHAQNHLCIEIDTMIKTWKSLDQYGLLASMKGHGTLTTRKMVAGKRESVIHINRSELPSLK